jgi:hypothetical protein
MIFSPSAAAPRRTPLAACLAVVLGTAAIFATSGDAFATWQRNHDKHPTTRAHALASANVALHHGPINHQALQAHLRAKVGAAKHADPHRPLATQTVTNCNDSGAGSLRDAVANAGSGDTINFSLSCSTITLTTGAIATPLDDLTINGPGAASLTIDADGGDRALFHYGYGTLTVNNVTVANGYFLNYYFAGGGCIASTGSVTLSNSVVTGCNATAYYFGNYLSFGQGGGVYASGSVTLTNSTVSNSTAYDYSYGLAISNGGGIYARGTITLTNSTLSGNRVEGYGFNYGAFIRGGGVYGYNGQSVSITGSTIDNNYSVGGGAGIAIVGATLTLSNSTVSGNYSYSGYGGGVFANNYSALTIGNSTIADNYAYSYAGGVSIYGSQLDLQSTIIASNVSGTDSADADFAGYTLTGANNLIVTTSYPVPSGTLTTDPNLQPLANNGGPTQTMALITGSSAIDQGNNAAGLATDQRGTGYPRVSGAATDIGAFELRRAGGQGQLAETEPAPTLSTWAQWLLAGAMGLFGFGFLRRKQLSSESS